MSLGSSSSYSAFGVPPPPPLPQDDEDGAVSASSARVLFQNTHQQPPPPQQQQSAEEEHQYHHPYADPYPYHQQQQQSQQHGFGGGGGGSTASYQSQGSENSNTTNVMEEFGWERNIDDEIRRRREELQRVRDDTRASVQFLEKAHHTMSPNASPSMHQFVARIMSASTSSIPSSSSSSSRTPLGPHNPTTTPGGSHFHHTPRTGGGDGAAGAGNASLRSSVGTLGIVNAALKEEAGRLRADLEQQAAMLAHEKQRAEEFQELAQDLAGTKASLLRKLDAQAREVEEYQRAVAHLEAEEREAREKRRAEEEDGESRLELLQMELEREKQENSRIYEALQRAEAGAEDQKNMLQGVIEERNGVIAELQHRAAADAESQSSLPYLQAELERSAQEIQRLRQEQAAADEAAQKAKWELETELVRLRQAYGAQLEQLQQQATAVMTPPPPLPAVDRSGEIQALTEALDTVEAAKSRLEGDVEQYRQDSEAYRAQAEHLQHALEEAQQRAAALTPAPPMSLSPPAMDRSGEVEALTQALDSMQATKCQVESDLEQYRQAAEGYRAEAEQLRQTLEQQAAMASTTPVPPSEDLQSRLLAAEAANWALQEELQQQQEAYRAMETQLRRDLQLQEAMGSPIPSTARGAGPQQPGELGERTWALEEEVHRQQGEIAGYVAELERLRQELAAVPVPVPADAASAATSTSPGLLPPPPQAVHAAQSPSQGLEATVHALQETNHALVLRLQEKEGQLQQAYEVYAEKELLSHQSLEALRDALEQEREGHQLALGEAVTALEAEVQRLQGDVQRLDGENEAMEAHLKTSSLFLVLRIVKHIKTKHSLKTPQRAFYRWQVAMLQAQLQEARQLLAGGGSQAQEELGQLKAENETLRNELQQAPAGRAAGGQAGASTSVLPSIAVVFIAVGVVLLEQQFALMGGSSRFCHVDTPRITF